MATTDLHGSSAPARRRSAGQGVEPAAALVPAVEISVFEVPPGHRWLDVAMAGSLLVITSPLLAAVALVVRCSGTPVLFRHTRVGAGGRLFPMYKFRTMVPEAEALLSMC